MTIEAPAPHAARVLLQALAALGVRHVVLAPGSRSAPLAHALAALSRPAPSGGGVAAPDLTLHVRVDERAAGFLALGLVRATGAPVAVVTTSGTAVANLHPAVLEADAAGLPLLLLTADRPHELRGTGANQTTAQVGLFAPAVRLTLDVPAPTGHPGEDRDLRHAASRAVAAALGTRTADPGPVHLNLAYREPLAPLTRDWPAARALPDAAGPVAAVPPPGLVTVVAAGPGPVAPVAGFAPGDDATIVVAGDGAGPAARALAESNGWPLLAEPSSGARGGPNAVPAYRTLLALPALGGRVRRVVVLGRPTLSRPVHALLARDDVAVLVVAPTGASWPDAVRSARGVVPAVPADLAAGAPGDPAWLTAWQRAGAAAADAVDRVLETGGDAEATTGAGSAPGAGSTGSGRLDGSRGTGASTPADAVAIAGSGTLAGPAVAAAVARASGPDDMLVVGSSNPVRDLDLVAGWVEPPRVVANRGLAGIDGTIGTASGIALGLGRPVRVLLGDLTFLHDAGSLLVGPLERRPDLQIVVVDDDGGSIFATLEHGEPRHADGFERVFATPVRADLAALCAGYGVAYAAIDSIAALREALAAPVVGTTVLHVRVDRAGRRRLAADLATAAAEAARATLL